MYLNAIHLVFSVAFISDLAFGVVMLGFIEWSNLREIHVNWANMVHDHVYHHVHSFKKLREEILSNYLSRERH